MFVSIMTEQKVVTDDVTDEELRKEMMRDIRKNVATLKTSIDQILHDMEYIRSTKLEIIEKLDCVKNEKEANTAQIQATLGKAKKIMRKSEENRRKLELVLRKMNEFNFVHTFTNFTDPPVVIDISDSKKNDKDKEEETRVVCKREKIKLRLLENNKYLLASAENKEEREKHKPDFKWGRESSLRELQWLVKMKLYKLRHRYDKLPFEQEAEERTPLPMSWRRASGERA